MESMQEDPNKWKKKNEKEKTRPHFLKFAIFEGGRAEKKAKEGGGEQTLQAMRQGRGWKCKKAVFLTFLRPKKGWFPTLKIKLAQKMKENN